MPPAPVPADPGWDDDLAWLDRDPMTAGAQLAGPGLRARRAARAGRVRGLAPLTAEELAEIRQAAADELLAVEAATTGRRGPGQPGSARVFPGQSSSPAAAFGPGMVFDVLPGCAQLAVAADAAAGTTTVRRRLRGRAGRHHVRVGPGRGPRRGPQARRGRRAGPAEPRARRRGVHRGPVANALGESRFRADELTGTAGHLDTHLPGTRAALRDGTVSLARPGRRHRHRPARPGRGRRGRGRGAGPGRAADPRRAARRDRPRRDGGRPRQGEEAAETAARFARVERWAEDSGNAALAGRELPPDRSWRR